MSDTQGEAEPRANSAADRAAKADDLATQTGARERLAGHLRRSLSDRTQNVGPKPHADPVTALQPSVPVNHGRASSSRSSGPKKGTLLSGAIGIGFEDALVNAIVAGAKRVTRRPVRPQPNLVSATASDWVDEFQNPIVRAYGSVGSLLYVKEKWARDPDGRAILARLVPDGGEPGRRVRWKSPRYMPKEAARLMLRVTEVRIERLHELDSKSAISEGAGHVAPDQDPLWWFRETWDRIYAPLGMGWDANPWVWVVGFQPNDADKPASDDQPIP